MTRVWAGTNIFAKKPYKFSCTLVFRQNELSGNSRTTLVQVPDMLVS